MANGTPQTLNYAGIIGADTNTVPLAGAIGGNATPVNGNGGNASINVAGNIYNNPLGPTLVITGAAKGGDGAGTGNGGNATSTINGNIIQTKNVLSLIELDAIAIGGVGTKSGNASATINGNIVQYTGSSATNVTLSARATQFAPDIPANHGMPGYGTKTATINGNIVQGNINNVTLEASARNSNGTATINGNIVTAKPANTGNVLFEATGQKITINGNIVNLGQQELDITLHELATTPTTFTAPVVSGNIFNGTNAVTNNLVLAADFLGAPASTNTATVDLGAGTLVINGQSNIINKFSGVTLSTGFSGSVTGSSGNNTLNGGSGNDFLSGLAGDDTLNGLNGNDILFGGTGNDALDGGFGLDVAYFAGRETQYTLPDPPPVFPGIFHVNGGPDGNDTLTQVERIKFLSPSHVSDVDNNGYGDLIFQDTVLNTITVATHPGPVANDLTFVPAAGVKVIGTGQFNPDVNRKSDILLQDGLGNLSVLLDINGIASIGPVALTGPSITPLTLNANWKAITAGDFNGDAAADVLLQNSVTGAAEIMLVNGTNYLDPVGTVDSTTAVVTPGLNWKAISSGDFNGDGKSDILWQNSVSGQTEVYLMNGAAIGTTGAAMSPAAGLTAIGSGDFNNDGKSDIIYQDTNGGTNNAVIWLMNGTTQTGLPINVLNTGGATYSLKGAEDINNDGFSDLLWQDSVTGNVRAIEMTTGGAVLGTANFAPAANTFQLVASTGGG